MSPVFTEGLNTWCFNLKLLLNFHREKMVLMSVTEILHGASFVQTSAVQMLVNLYMSFPSLEQTLARFC